MMLRRVLIGLAVVVFAAACGGETVSRAASLTYDQQVKADGAVAYWRMASTTGSEADSTSRGHACTYTGSHPLTTMPNSAPATVFDGASTFCAGPDKDDLSITTTKKLSWEAWIRPDTLQFPNASTGYADFLGKCESYSPSCEWEGRMYSLSNSSSRPSRISAYAFNPGAGLGAGADWQPQSGVFSSGQWIHVVAEYDLTTTPARCNSAYPGSINIWVDGVKWNDTVHGTTGCMSQYSIKPQNGTSRVLIGTMARDYWFKGAIGKVAVYDLLLTPAQIAQHYTKLTGKAVTGACGDTCHL